MKSQMDELYEETDESLENQFRQKSLNKLILNYIKGKTVFEVGCGSGTLLKELQSLGFKVSGCDVSNTQCNLAKKRLKKSNIVYNISLEDTSEWKRKFNSVVCIDVLEHIKNDKTAFKQLFKLVKTSGRLIILVPAFRELWTNRDIRYGHYRRYTKESLERIFTVNTSLKILTLRYWNFIGALVTWFLIKLNLKIDTDRAISKKNIFISNINKLLGFWLQNVESYNIFPYGLSLLAVFEKS